MPRLRSPNYPAIGLTDAIKLAKDLWNKEKNTTVRPEVATAAWGYKSLSGPARTRIAALKKYGLVDQNRQGVRLSKRAVQILNYPEDSAEYTSAVREAAFLPELFKELSASHADASDRALEAHLISERQFSPGGAKQVIAAFKDTMSLAKRDASGYSGDSDHEESEDKMDPGSEIGSRGASGKPTIRLFSWPLSRELSAEVRFTGEDIKPAHLERLREYLELAKSAIANEDE